MATPHPVHPLGSQAKILLTSVFGPYARDDEYGSRSINPMELYHNQVTREQGPFSLRMFHRSFGLMMIEANIDAACTLLDFPTLERFIDELQTHTYDIIGITAILPNYRKVIKMCELIRSHQPQATIVVGGHIAAMPGIERIIAADHIVRGEGVRWFRAFLGQDVGAPVRHPRTLSGFGARSFGITFPERRGETAAAVIPSVGCPMGCNFCSTSALFGGKGKFVNFFETGDDLFAVMRDLEKALQVRSFFVMDENFLLHKARALRLLELMEQHQKSWSLYVFSSAAVLRSYTCEQLVRLGIAWVWMGIEGEHSRYAKLNGVDTRDLVRDLQSHGIGVLGSTIIGLEEHTPDNIGEHIAYAVSHATDFHQFMLYTPLPGTPLYEQFRQEGRLLPEQEFSAADTHGQYRFNYRHKHIPPGRETELLRSAFQQDFAANGPSLFRMFRTTLRGWQRYKEHPDARVRDRFRWQARGLATSIAGAVWAMRRWYRDDEPMREKIDALLRDLYAAFGWKARCCAPILGRLIYCTTSREAQRLRSGWAYEPPVVYEKNARMRAFEKEALFPAVITMPRLQSFVGHLTPTFDVLSRIKVRHRAYRQARLLRKTYGVPVRPSAAAALWERTALRVRAQVTAGQRRLVMLNLHGAFNRHIGRQLKARIETYLRNNAGLLTIDFSGITAAEAKALCLFFKNLRGYRDRIRIVNLDALKADCSEAVAYARALFAEGPAPAENPA